MIKKFQCQHFIVLSALTSFFVLCSQFSQAIYLFKKYIHIIAILTVVALADVELEPLLELAAVVAAVVAAIVAAIVLADFDGSPAGRRKLETSAAVAHSIPSVVVGNKLVVVECFLSLHLFPENGPSNDNVSQSHIYTKT